MVEDAELWKICFGISIVVCNFLKAVYVALTPHIVPLSQKNSFQSSEYFIVRFLYDFIWSFTNIIWMICSGVPVAAIMYVVIRYFV